MKKRIVLILTVIVLAVSLCGCADVNYRFTRLYEGGYRQTLTITLNKEEIEATTSYSIDKIKAVLVLVLKNEDYAVTENGYTVTAVKDFETMEDVNASLLGTGYAMEEDGSLTFIGTDEKLTDYRVEKGLFFTTTYQTGRSIFYQYDNYTFLYFEYYSGYDLNGVFKASHLNITYEYASIYKSIGSENGTGEKEGRYYVNTYNIDEENQDVVIVTRTPNIYVWYAFDLLLVALFIIIAAVIAKKNKAKPFEGDTYGKEERN